MRLSLYRTLSLRYFQQRWFRAVLVVATVALGVATLVATRALNMSMGMATQTSARPMSGQSDLLVSNSDSGMSLDLAKELAQVPGVKSVLPLVIEHVVLPDLDNRHAYLIGAEVSSDGASGDSSGIRYDIPDLLYALSQGSRIVLVGEQLSRDLSTKIGKEGREFRVRVRGETRTLPRWAGTVSAEGEAAALGGNVLFTKAAYAAELLNRPGRVSRIDLKLEPNVDREEVRSRVELVLRDRAEVQSPESLDRSMQDLMAGLQIGFSLCGAGALVIGLFLVYNVMSVGVVERRHEIGILRSLGSTRGQILALFMGEAGLLGLAGAVVGVPAGIGLARLFLGPTQEVFHDLFGAAEVREVMLTAGTLLGSATAGVVTSILAALIPALRASGEEPASAVRRNPPPSGMTHQIMQAAFSLSLIVAGVCCLLLRTHLPMRVGTYGCLVLILLGLLLLTPFVTGIITRLLSIPARRFFRIESRLAADNLVRSPGRTGLVIAALSAGVAMVVQTAGVIRSNKDVVLDWLDQRFQADLLVASGNIVSGEISPLKDSVAADIKRSDPDIRAVLPVRFLQVDFNSKKVLVVAIESKEFLEQTATTRKTSDLDIYQRLREPGPARVIVSDNFAALHGVKVGDTITVRGPHGPLSFEVAGTIVDFTWNLGTILMDRSVYLERFEDPLVDAFHVFLEHPERREIVREHILQKWEQEHALAILTRKELYTDIQKLIDRLYYIAYSQEAVVGIVAALGVVTALLISVMQRRAELGILRALGATRAQVIRAVLAEAVFIGLIGTFLGLLVGVPVEWYILRVIIFEEAGFRFAVSIPWQEAGIIAGLAMSIATLSGLGPALVTLKLRIPEAIAYE